MKIQIPKEKTFPNKQKGKKREKKEKKEKETKEQEKNNNLNHSRQSNKLSSQIGDIDREIKSKRYRQLNFGWGAKPVWDKKIPPKPEMTKISERGGYSSYYKKLIFTEIWC